MRFYETAFLIAPNLPEEEIDQLVKKLADVVSKKKGKMGDIDNWGKKKLAYPIEKFEEAYYFFFNYQAEPAAPSELERHLKQSESILRYMTFKIDPRENTRKESVKTKKAPPKKEPETTSEKQEDKVPEVSQPEPEEEK